MLTKYFMRGINIQKHSNVFLEESVFSHVGCLSLSGFDEISKAVFETGTSLTEKAEQERKRLQNVYAPMLCVLNCVLLTGKVKLFLKVERERERECCLWELKGRVCALSLSHNGEKERVVFRSQNVRGGVLGRREYI